MTFLKNLFLKNFEKYLKSCFKDINYPKKLQTIV